MQFDSVARTYRYWNGRRYVTEPGPDKALFEVLKQRFEDAGYKMPKLVFWNVANRNAPVPVTVNEMGVVLLSGFAPATLKMALTGKTDPYEAMVEVLLNKRYDPVENAVLKAVGA